MSVEIISPSKQFLYNLIHYCLILEGFETAPLSYNQDSILFSINLPEYYNTQNTLKKVKEFLDQILEVSLLVPFEDPESIYLDQDPTFLRGVFKYNPYKQLYQFTQSSIPEIMTLINKLVINKKSRSLKYSFLHNKDLTS